MLYKKDYNKMSLIFGVLAVTVGIFLEMWIVFPNIFSVMAIVCAYKGKKSSKENKIEMKGKIGLVLGMITAVLYIAGVVISVWAYMINNGQL